MTEERVAEFMEWLGHNITPEVTAALDALASRRIAELERDLAGVERHACELHQDGQRSMQKRALRAALDVLFAANSDHAGDVERAIRALEVECTCSDRHQDE